MKSINFSSIFEFSKKTKRKAGDGQSEGQYPFFTSSVVQKKFINSKDCHGPSLIFGTGGSANVHYCDEYYSASGDCLISKPQNKKKINTKFVYYFLSKNIHILETGFKGAGLKHISKSYISNLKIPLPSINYQNNIVSILDKADAIRRKRQHAIQLADEFLRSVFLDMFGNPVKNPTMWKKEILSNLLAEKPNAIRTGPFGSQLKHSEFVSEGIPVLGIDNIVTNEFRWTAPRCLPPKKYDNFKRYRVYPDDVIITIMGTTGRVAVTPFNLPECMSTKHLCVITLNKKILDPVFLWSTLLFDRVVRGQAKISGGGAIMEGWNMSIIKKLRIRIPPIDLQRKYRRIIEKTKKNRANSYNFFNESDKVFNSITQRAFRGEL